jgi:hypothetical protein
MQGGVHDQVEEGNLVSGVFAERQLAVEYDTAEKVLTDKGQSEIGLCQRAYTMAVMLSHPASMHKRIDFETAKEVIDFALNIDRVLRLGGNADMVHLSPFSLCLL